MNFRMMKDYTQANKKTSEYSSDVFYRGAIAAFLIVAPAHANDKKHVVQQLHHGGEQAGNVGERGGI